MNDVEGDVGICEGEEDDVDWCFWDVDGVSEFSFVWIYVWDGEVGD